MAMEEGAMAKAKLVAAVVVLEMLIAGFHVVSRAALNMGVSKMAFLVYRNGSALLVIAPVAYFLEKKERPPLTLRLMIDFFMLATVGVTFTQGLYILGLYYLSPTYVSVIQNSVPAITFVMAAVLRVSLPRLQPQRSEMSTVTRTSLDQKLALAKRCSREANVAGAKAAAVATIASAIPTLASVRMLPWAKANINPTGQALIISTVAGMAYFIAADKKILSLARRHSFEEAPEHLKNTSFHGTGRLHPAFFRP